MAICFYAVVTLVVIGAVWATRVFFGSSFNNEQAAYLCIDADDDLDSVRVKLKEAGQTNSLTGFGIVSRVLDLDGDKLHTGRYEVTDDTSMPSLLRHIRNHSQAPVDLVVPSVRTVSELAGRLADHLMLDSATIAGALTDSAFCASRGYTVEQVPALFIPNTYEVYWDVTLEDLVARMEKENAAFWNAERSRKAEEMGLTHVEVVTLASIVDEETAADSEKPRIAGLYLNRLRKPMPLQSDPTVKFALGDFSLKRILHEHLSVDSPYNTYKEEGLPPGPIRIPSIKGIDAVLNYERHDFMYMCAKEDFSGTHNFAVSYAEHLANARRYTAALNARGIK